MMRMLVDLRHWPSMLNGGALMNLLTLGNRGRICVDRNASSLINPSWFAEIDLFHPAKFREQYPELAVGRRRRRKDVAANEVAQMVSTVTLESSLWSSDTWQESC